MNRPPAIPVCERCAKKLVTVTLGDVQGGARETYRICSNCWTELGAQCPQSVRTDENALAGWIIDALREERAKRGGGGNK